MADQGDPGKEPSTGDVNKDDENLPVEPAPKPMPMPMNLAPRKKSCRDTPFVGGCVNKPPKLPIGVQDIKSPNFGREVMAEFFGTMFLMFFGCISYVSSTPNDVEVSEENWFVDEDGHNHTYVLWKHTTHYPEGPGPGKGMGDTTRPNRAINFSPFHIAAAFGLTYASLVQVLSHVSGAHLNPAVSWGIFMAGKCSLLKCLCFMVTQFISGLLGGGMVWLATHHIRVDNAAYYKPNGKIAAYSDVVPNWGMGSVQLAAGVPQFDGMMAEFFATFLMVITIVSVNDENRKDLKGSGPLAIGFAVFAAHLGIYRLSGACFNPARALGVAIYGDMEKRWVDMWLYLIGPILGATEAAVTYCTFFHERPQLQPLPAVTPV